MSKIGYLYVAGFTGLFAYLSQPFMGPLGSKITIHPEAAQVAKEYQPAIDPEFYSLKRDKKNL